MEDALKKYKKLLDNVQEDGQCGKPTTNPCDTCPLWDACDEMVRNHMVGLGKKYHKFKIAFLKRHINRIEVLQAWKKI